MSKEKTKRGKTKFPNLHPELNLKTRYELIDYDYIDKLSTKEKKWLDKFTKEYTSAALDTEDLSKNLHNTVALKKDCQDRNNSRNRCILTRAKASGYCASIDEMKEKKQKIKTESPEDQLIAKIDLPVNSED